jgi:hypothetical protein
LGRPAKMCAADVASEKWKKRRMRGTVMRN